MIGRPDPDWGHKIVAVVVLSGDTTPTLDDLRDYVRADLPAWNAPKELVVVESLPKTALGKVRKADL